MMTLLGVGISILVVLLRHTTLSQVKCPSIDKCDCTVGNVGSTEYHYDCGNSAITEIPNFPNTTIFINLKSNTIEVLPDDIFQNNQKVTELSLQDNMIEVLPEDMCAYLSELKILDLSKNKIKVLPADTFKTCNGLIRLRLDDNMIEIFPDEVFAENTELLQLDLSRNSITVLNANIFKTKTNPKGLYMMFNVIEILPIEFFTAIAEIKDLYLSYNMITHLPVDIFAENYELRTLNLERNKISYLPENIFAANVNLEVLYLAENPIETFYVGTFNTNSLIQVEISFNCNCIKKKIYELILQELENSVFDVICKGSTDKFKELEITSCLDGKPVGNSSKKVVCACPEHTTVDGDWHSLDAVYSTSASVIVSSGEILPAIKSKESILLGTPYLALGAVLGTLFGTSTAVTMIVGLIRKIMKVKEFKMKAEKTQNDEDKDQSSYTIDMDIIDNFSVEAEVVARFSNTPPVNHIAPFL